VDADCLNVAQTSPCWLNPGHLRVGRSEVLHRIVGLFCRLPQQIADNKSNNVANDIAPQAKPNNGLLPPLKGSASRTNVQDESGDKR